MASLSQFKKQSTFQAKLEEPTYGSVPLTAVEIFYQNALVCHYVVHNGTLPGTNTAQT